MVKTLVVDDDDGVLDLVATLLRRAGHDVTTAGDGRAAYELLLVEAFDLCVLDHELPGMTGLEIAGALRATGRETRFVVLSGLARLQREPLEAVELLVQKPFDSARFLSVIDELMAS